MKSQYFFIGKELNEPTLILAKIVINNICNTTFFTCNIFNLITNFITIAKIR